MKKYYSLILFAVFVLLAGAILLTRGGKENAMEENGQSPSFADDTFINDGESDFADTQSDMDDVNAGADVENVDLENIEVDFEQDVNETEDVLNDYSDFDEDINVDSIDEGLL
ncbi:MAG: hypothetical protein M0P97_01585 [Candidatus Moranbacteria bacterium]|jgi:hypothetical protein|nr:hypothetical protein [Candidatus Moranbacteria bacterium]